MKKSTFFLSLFLTVSGVATTNAQGTFLKPEDIKDGRVITLKGVGSNKRYMKMSALGLDNFDPKETAVVVEKADENGNFYLKKYSDEQYLQKPTDNNALITLGSKEGAALFTVTKVQRSDASNSETYEGDPLDGVTANDVLRFITTNGTTKVFLNSNSAGLAPKYYDGVGSLSIFAVFDAAELYYYNNMLPTYVEDPTYSEEVQKDVYGKYTVYKSGYSEEKYRELVETELPEETKPAVLDTNLYYLIENNNTRGTYMTTNKDKTLSGASLISGDASQIWHLEAVADENKQADFKYVLSAQGGYCSTPVLQKSVELLSKEEQASFYMIPDVANFGPGVYAFDSQFNDLRGWSENDGKGLHLSSGRVIGYGTGAGTSKWKLKFARTCTLVMPAEGWTTLNLPFAVSLPENEDLTVSYPTDAKKYIDEKTNELVNRVTMTPLNSNKIPANFPVVLQGNEGTYTLTILSADEVVSAGDVKANKFKGVLLPEDVSPVAMFNLELNDGEFTLSEPNNENDEPITITVAANSAYIPSNNVTTGITDVVAADTNADNVWFDLVGRRVLNPAKGVYVNAAGKKALFK